MANQREYTLAKGLIDFDSGDIGRAVVFVDPNTGDPLTGGDVGQAVPDATTPAEALEQYGNFAGVAPSDFVVREAYSNGQVVLALSTNPTVEDSESFVIVSAPVLSPAALDIEASISRRVRHDFATVSLFDGESHTVPADINIVTAYQCTATDGAAYNAAAGTVLTLVLDTALPASVYLSDWVHVYGLVDNRLNYPNLCIRWISLDRKTIVCGFSDEQALPSLAATYSPAAGTAKVKFYNNMGGAENGAGFRFTGNSATSAALLSIFGGNDVQISGTLQGDHRVTIGSTNPTYGSVGMGNVELKATSRFRLETGPREVSYNDRAVDTSVAWSNRAIRTAVKPAIQATMRPRFRAINPKSMTRPVAKIVSVSKAGSTTWNITLDRTCASAGLVTGNYCTVKGVRDQTNFANFATPAQITVTGANTLTLVSTTGTATSYGGSLILTNGGVDQQGFLAQSVQSATVDATTGALTLVGSAAWSTGVGVMNVGDYVELHGLRVDTTGADLGLDGPWKVANISTTSLILLPVFDIFGTRRSPAVASLALTNCGGTVLHRTTLRAHDLVVEQWADIRQTLDGQGTMRADKAMPVAVVGTVTANEGTPQTGTGQTLTSAASTNATSVKASAGSLMEASLFNATAATVYLKFYNKASAPTVGTDVPILTIPVAAGAVWANEFGRFGKRFATGIALAITGAAAATDATAIAAGAQLSLTYN